HNPNPLSLHIYFFFVRNQTSFLAAPNFDNEYNFHILYLIISFELLVVVQIFTHVLVSVFLLITLLLPATSWSRVFSNDLKSNDEGHLDTIQRLLTFFCLCEELKRQYFTEMKHKCACALSGVQQGV
ncbi:hypothetical protein ACJX0J_015290, partial [Zea mays]